MTVLKLNQYQYFLRGVSFTDIGNRNTMRKPLNKLLITCFVRNSQVFRLNQLNLTILKILVLHTVKLVFNCHPWDKWKMIQ